ncbi:hypothetical protein SBRY_90007 [Actinacidiphila bryophytorum]|uniref:Uncharacterized protein n=1 Tax=Actinacidiphila bryophytorum TaxID=1436133 RepID=A0A9W4H8B6_9ACTN|nr:hypothetical protein SBRY_90007 [Actinacidiphila bryophytorum]
MRRCGAGGCAARGRGWCVGLRRTRAAPSEAPRREGVTPPGADPLNRVTASYTLLTSDIESSDRIN